VRFILSCFAIVLLPKSTAVQYYVADFSFRMLTFLRNSVSAVSLSALFFWNQLTALSEGCLYVFWQYCLLHTQILFQGYFFKLPFQIIWGELNENCNYRTDLSMKL
jgi:hypothetical protein